MSPRISLYYPDVTHVHCNVSIISHRTKLVYTQTFSSTLLNVLSPWLRPHVPGTFHHACFVCTHSFVDGRNRKVNSDGMHNNFSRHKYGHPTVWLNVNVRVENVTSQNSLCNTNKIFCLIVNNLSRRKWPCGIAVRRHTHNMVNCLRLNLPYVQRTK